MRDERPRECARCHRPTQSRAWCLVGGLCFSCSTGRPRLLSPETLAEYARTTTPPLLVTRTTIRANRRLAE